MSSHRILLIEDDLDVAGDICRYLQSKGHQVTHIVALTQTRPGGLSGVEAGGATAVPLDLSNIDVCLMDGILKETAMSREQKGWELIRHLSREGDFPLIALSSEDTFNDRMVAAGAITAVLKSELGPKLLPAIEMAVASQPRKK